MINPGAELIEAYDLGRLIALEKVSGGGPAVRKLITDTGTFLVKPAYQPFVWELYGTMETRLNDRGVRQARLIRTTQGAAVSPTGHVVQEWLDGQMTMTPDAQQTRATFRHLAHYTAELAGIGVPTELITSETIFDLVTETAWLTDNVGSLLRLLPDDWARAPLDVALSHLGDLPALPAQLVHGDVGPDNVLFAGRDVLAIIDFTPCHAPAVFGLCTALYWFFVHGRTEPDRAGLNDACAAFDEIRPLTVQERAALPPMLIKEALRRLATPLALAGPAAAPVDTPSVRHRYRAVVALVTRYDDLIDG